MDITLIKKNTIIEKINHLVKFEAEEYIKKDKFINNKIVTYRLKEIFLLSYGKVKIIYPKFLKRNKEFKLSFIEKYSRYLKEEYDYLKNIILNENLAYSDIENILKVPIPRSIKKEVKEYYEKQFKEGREKVHSFPVIKLDSTYISKGRYMKSVYMIYGYDKGKKYIIYQDAVKGRENGSGWERAITWIKNHVDLSKVEVVLSDMFGSLKKHLKTLAVPLQNCMWHRFNSIIIRIKENSLYQNNIFRKFYKDAFECESKEELEELFRELDKYDYKIIKSKGYQVQTDLEKMLSRHYEDNFTFFNFSKEMRKLVFQNMDIESVISTFKRFLRKCHCRLTPEKINLLMEKFKRSRGYLFIE